MLNVWYIFTTYIYPLQKLPRFVGIYTRPMEHHIIASSAAEVQNNERQPKRGKDPPEETATCNLRFSSKHVGVSQNRGKPQNGWFIIENPIKNG